MAVNIRFERTSEGLVRRHSLASMCSLCALRNRSDQLPPQPHGVDVAGGKVDVADVGDASGEGGWVGEVGCVGSGDDGCCVGVSGLSPQATSRAASRTRARQSTTRRWRIVKCIVGTSMSRDVPRKTAQEWGQCTTSA